MEPITVIKDFILYVLSECNSLISVCSVIINHWNIMKSPTPSSSTPTRKRKLLESASMEQTAEAPYLLGSNEILDIQASNRTNTPPMMTKPCEGILSPPIREHLLCFHTYTMKHNQCKVCVLFDRDKSPNTSPSNPGSGVYFQLFSGCTVQSELIQNPVEMILFMCAIHVLVTNGSQIVSVFMESLRLGEVSSSNISGSYTDADREYILVTAIKKYCSQQLSITPIRSKAALIRVIAPTLQFLQCNKGRYNEGEENQIRNLIEILNPHVSSDPVTELHSRFPTLTGLQVYQLSIILHFNIHAACVIWLTDVVGLYLEYQQTHGALSCTLFILSPKDNMDGNTNPLEQEEMGRNIPESIALCVPHPIHQVLDLGVLSRRHCILYLLACYK